MYVSNQSFDEFVDRNLDPDYRNDVRGFSSVICLAVPGTPVIYVSSEFESHTGYSAEEAYGKNLAFLQGPDTEQAAIEEFRTLIESATPGTILITNYRKDGTAFLHECELRPIKSEDGSVTHFIAVQRMVA